ncbi:hypothetical protein ACFY0F_00350 [Streptomyces sp. NPDC001544]|uniref:hypothetical protein n=1 Tax=Streptomyces sp. NPDC001544 TaxID=3364584 RepID=UPI0036CD40EC
MSGRVRRRCRQPPQKDAYGRDTPVGTALGITSITMDVWVGSGDLPVRMKQKQS